jgi:4-amino-4-deoxy-L-arabinose transferase-like glycosyltransferase
MGKDAALSITNIGALVSLIAMFAASRGYYVDEATLTGIVSFAITVYGRWRAGGVASVLGVPIPQSKGAQP